MIETEEEEVKTKVVYLKDGKDTFRYLLTNQWHKYNDKIAAVIMLNLSKASSIKMDQTVINVINHLYKRGFGGMIIVNLFSYLNTFIKRQLH